ncbi:MAG TPA: hypothetical protein VGP93_01805 [Polyangiaceae bacterium]|jgi:hypothetical protein|nr:hypothetical protein [Polyangiaceae bacterium]
MLTWVGSASAQQVEQERRAQSTRAEPEPVPYWDEGAARPFLSLAPALGAVSNLDLALGWGKPHWMWGGIEGTALSTFDFGAVSVGPRVALLLADLSVKRRLTHAYRHPFLARRASYSASDVEDGPGESADYGAWDVSLWGLVPLPFGYGIYELAGTWVDGVPAGHDLFEEYQRVVIRGDRILAIRLGLSAWLVRDVLGAGLLVEWLSAEDRGVTWRLGPSLDCQFSDHLSASAVYTLPVSAPDSLGAWTGAWGTLRLRYTWASGEPRPEFP